MWCSLRTCSRLIQRFLSLLRRPFLFYSRRQNTMLSHIQWPALLLLLLLL
jgi:hypothetical protein